MADDVVDSESVSSAVTDVSGIVVFKERLKKLSDTANGLLESIDKVILKKKSGRCAEKTSTDVAVQNYTENEYRFLDPPPASQWAEYHEVSQKSSQSDRDRPHTSRLGKRNRPKPCQNHTADTELDTVEESISRPKNRNKRTQTSGNAAMNMSNRVFIDDIAGLLNPELNKNMEATVAHLMPLEQNCPIDLMSYELMNANCQTVADKKSRPKKCHCGKQCPRVGSKHRQYADEPAVTDTRSTKEHSKGSGDFVASNNSSKSERKKSEFSTSLSKESIPNAEFVTSGVDSVKMCGSKVYIGTGGLTTSTYDSTMIDMKSDVTNISQQQSCKQFTSAENSSHLTSFSKPFPSEFGVFSDFKEESEEIDESASVSTSEDNPKLVPVAAYAEEVSSITEECTSSFENYSVSSNSERRLQESGNNASLVLSCEKIRAHSIRDISALSLKPDRIKGYGVMNILKSVSSNLSSERFATTQTNVHESGVCSPNTSGLGKSSASQSSVSASISVSQAHDDSKASEFGTKTTEQSFTSTNSFIRSIKTQESCPQCGIAKGFNCKNSSFSSKREASEQLTGSSSDSLYSGQRYPGNHLSSVTENIYSESYSIENTARQFTTENTRFDTESAFPELKTSVSRTSSKFESAGSETSLNVNSSCSKRSMSVSKGSLPLFYKANYQTSAEKDITDSLLDEPDRQESSGSDSKLSGSTSLYNTSAFKTDRQSKCQDLVSSVGYKHANPSGFSGSALIEQYNKQKCIQSDLSETYSFLDDQSSKSENLNQYKLLNCSGFTGKGSSSRINKIHSNRESAISTEGFSQEASKNGNKSSRVESVCIYTDFFESGSESLKSSSNPVQQKVANKATKKIEKQKSDVSTDGSSIIEMVLPGSTTTIAVEEFPLKVFRDSSKPLSYCRSQKKNHSMADESEITVPSLSRTSNKRKYAHRETLSYTGSTLSRQLESEETDSSVEKTYMVSERSLPIKNMPPLKHRAVFDFNVRQTSRNVWGSIISVNDNETLRSKNHKNHQESLCSCQSSSCAKSKITVSTIGSSTAPSLQRGRKNKGKLTRSSQKETSWLSSDGEMDSMQTSISNTQKDLEDLEVSSCSCNASSCNLDTPNLANRRKFNVESVLHVSSSISSELDSEVAHSWDHSSRKTFNQRSRQQKRVTASPVASSCSCGEPICSKGQSDSQECSSTVVTPSSIARSNLSNETQTHCDSKIGKPLARIPGEDSDTKQIKTTATTSQSDISCSCVAYSCVQSPSAVSSTKISSSTAGVKKDTSNLGDDKSRYSASNTMISQQSSCSCKNSSCLNETSNLDSLSASSLKHGQTLKQTASSTSLNTFACSSAALDIAIDPMDKSNGSESAAKTSHPSSCSCAKFSCLSRRSSLDALSASEMKQREAPSLGSSSVNKSGFDCTSVAGETDLNIDESQISATELKTPLDSTCSCANTSCLIDRSSITQTEDLSISPSSISKASLACSSVAIEISQNLIESSKNSETDSHHMEDSQLRKNQSLLDESETKTEDGLSIGRTASSCNCENSSCQQDMLIKQSTTNTENTFACSSAAIEIDPDFVDSIPNSEFHSQSSKHSTSIRKHHSIQGSSTCMSVLSSSTVNTVETEIDLKSAIGLTPKKSVSRSETPRDSICSCQNSSCVMERSDLESRSSITGQRGKNVDENSTATGRGTHVCSSVALNIDADFEESFKSSQSDSISVSVSKSPEISCAQSDINSSKVSSLAQKQPAINDRPSAFHEEPKKSSDATRAVVNDASTNSCNKEKDNKSKRCTCYKKLGKTKYSSSEISTSSCDEKTCRYRRRKPVGAPSEVPKMVQTSYGQTSSTSCSACERLWNDESLHYTSDEASLIGQPKNALNASAVPLSLRKMYHLNESCSNSVVEKRPDEDKNTGAKSDKRLVTEKPKKRISLNLASHSQETTSFEDSSPKNWPRKLPSSSSVRKTDKIALRPVSNKILSPSSLEDKLMDPCYQDMKEVDDICAELASKTSKSRFACDCATCECIEKESKEDNKDTEGQDGESSGQPEQENGNPQKEDKEQPPNKSKNETVKNVSNLNKTKRGLGRPSNLSSIVKQDNNLGPCSCSECSDQEYSRTKGKKYVKNVNATLSTENRIMLSNQHLLEQVRRSFDSSASSSSCSNNEDAPQNISQKSLTASQDVAKSIGSIHKRTDSAAAKMSMPSGLQHAKNTSRITILLEGPTGEETCDISEFEKKTLEGLENSDGCGCCQCDQTSTCNPENTQKDPVQEGTDGPDTNNGASRTKIEETEDNNDKDGNNQEFETNDAPNVEPTLSLVPSSVKTMISFTSNFSCQQSKNSSSVSNLPTSAISASAISSEVPSTPIKEMTESTRDIKNIKNNQPQKSVKRSRSCHCTRCKNRRNQKPEKPNAEKPEPMKADLIKPISEKPGDVSTKDPSQFFELHSNVSESITSCKLSSSSLSVGSSSKAVSPDKSLSSDPVKVELIQEKSEKPINEEAMPNSEHLEEESNLSHSILSCELLSSSTSATSSMPNKDSDVENTVSPDEIEAAPMKPDIEDSINTPASLDIDSMISESVLSCKFSTSSLPTHLSDKSSVKSTSVRELKPSSKNLLKTGSNLPLQHEKNCDCCKCGKSTPNDHLPEPTNVKTHLSVPALDEDLKPSNVSSSIHLHELTSSCELSSHSSWYKSSLNQEDKLFGETGSNQSVSELSLGTNEGCNFSSSILSTCSTGKSFLEKIKSPLPVLTPKEPAEKSKVCRCQKCGKRKSKKEGKSSTEPTMKSKPRLSAQEVCSATETKRSGCTIDEDVKTVNQSSDESTHTNMKEAGRKTRICDCSKCGKRKKGVSSSERVKPEPEVTLEPSGHKDSLESMSVSIVTTNLSSCETQEKEERAASSSFSSLERCSTELLFFAKGEEEADKGSTRKSSKHKNACKCTRCVKRRSERDKTEKPSLNIPQEDKSIDKDVSSVLQPSSHAISASDISELGTVTCLSIKTLSLSSNDYDEKDNQSEKPGEEFSVVSESVIPSVSSLEKCSTELVLLAEEAAKLSQSPSMELKKKKKVCRCSKCGKRKTRSKENEKGHHASKDDKKSTVSLEVLTASAISELPENVMDNTESCGSLVSLESLVESNVDADSQISQTTYSAKEDNTLKSPAYAPSENKKSARDSKSEIQNRPSGSKHCNCCKCTGRNQVSERLPRKGDKAAGIDIAGPTESKGDIVSAKSSQISGHSTCFSQKIADILAFSTSTDTMSGNLEKRKPDKPLNAKPEKSPECKTKKCQCRRCLKSNAYKSKTFQNPKPQDELVVNSENSTSKPLSFKPLRPPKKGIFDPSDSSKSTQDKYKRNACTADLTKSSKHTSKTSKQLNKKIKQKTAETSTELKSDKRAKLSKKCLEKGCQCKRCQAKEKPLDKSIQKMSYKNASKKDGANSSPWCSDFSELLESIVSVEDGPVPKWKNMSHKKAPKKTATSSLPWCLNESDSKQASENRINENVGHILTSWSSFMDSEAQSEAQLQQMKLENVSYRKKVTKRDNNQCLCACNTKDKKNGYDSDADEVNEVKGPKAKRTRKSNVTRRPMKRPPKHSETGSAAEAKPTQNSAPSASPVQAASNNHEDSCQCSPCNEAVQTRSPANQARATNSQKHEVESLEASSIEVKPREARKPKPKVKPESLRPATVNEPCICHVTCEVSKVSKHERVTMKPFNLAQAFRKPRVPQAAFNDSFESADSGAPVRSFVLPPVFNQNNSSAPPKHETGEVCICTETCSEKKERRVYSIEVKPVNKSKPKVGKNYKQQSTKVEQHLSTDDPEEEEIKTVNLKQSKVKEVHNRGVVFSPDLVNDPKTEDCPCVDTCQPAKPVHSEPIKTKPKDNHQASPKSSYKSVISEYELVIVKQAGTAPKHRPVKATTDYNSLSSESAAESIIEIKSYKEAKKKLKNKPVNIVPVASEMGHDTCPCQDPCKREKHMEQREPVQIKSSKLLPKSTTESDAESVEFKPLRLRHKTVTSPDEKCICDTCEEKSKMDKAHKTRAPVYAEPLQKVPVSIKPGGLKEKSKPKVEEPSTDEYEDIEIKHVFTRVTSPKPAIGSKVTIPPVITTKAPLPPEHDPQCPCNTCDTKPIIVEPVAVKPGGKSKSKTQVPDMEEENEPIEVKKGVVRISSPPTIERTKSLPVVIPTASTSKPIDEHCICHPCDDPRVITEPVSVKPMKSTKPKEMQKPSEAVHTEQDVPEVIEPMEAIEVKKPVLRINSRPRVVEETRSHPGNPKDSQCICHRCDVEPIISEPVAVKPKEAYSRKPAPLAPHSKHSFLEKPETVSVKKEGLRLRPTPTISESVRSTPPAAKHSPLVVPRDPECICNPCDKEPVIVEPVTFKPKQKEKNRTTIESEHEDEKIEPVDVKKMPIRLRLQRSVVETTKSPPVESNFKTFDPNCICDPCAIESIKPEPISVKPGPTNSLKPKPTTAGKSKNEPEIQEVEPIEVKKEAIHERPAVANSKSLPTIIQEKEHTSNNDPQCSCYDLCSQPPSKTKRQPMQSHPVLLKPVEVPKFLQKPKIDQSKPSLPANTPVRTDKEKKPPPISKPTDDIPETQEVHESNEPHDPQCICNLCKNKKTCESPPECETIKKEPTHIKQTDFSKILQKPRVGQTVRDVEVEVIEPIERKPKVPSPTPMSQKKEELPEKSISNSDHHTHCNCNVCEEKKKCQSPHDNCERILKEPVKVKSTTLAPFLQRPRILQPTEDEHEVEEAEPTEVKKDVKPTKNPVAAPPVNLDKPVASPSSVAQQAKCNCQICQDRSKCQSPPIKCEEQKKERVQVKPEDISKALQRPKISPFPEDRNEILVTEPLQVKKVASKIKSASKSAPPAEKINHIPSHAPCDCRLCKDKTKCQNPHQSCTTPKKEPINLKHADTANILQKPRIAKPEQADYEIQLEEPIEVKPKSASAQHPPKSTANKEKVAPVASAMETQHDPNCSCNTCESKSKCVSPSTQCRLSKSEPITRKVANISNILQKPRIPTSTGDEREIEIIEPTEVKKILPVQKPPRSVVAPTKPTPSTAGRQCNCSVCEDKSKCRSSKPNCEPVQTEPISTKSPDTTKGLQKPRIPKPVISDEEYPIAVPVEVKKDIFEPKTSPQETSGKQQAPSQHQTTAEEPKRQCQCKICENKSKCQSPKEACKPIKIEQIDYKPTDFSKILQKPRLIQASQNENILEVELPTEIKKQDPTTKPSTDKKKTTPAESKTDIQLDRHDSKCKCNVCESKAKCASPNVCKASKSEPVITKLSNISKLMKKPRIPQNTQDEAEILISEPINVKHVQPAKKPDVNPSNTRGTQMEDSPEEPSSAPRQCQCKVCQDKSKCQAPKVDCGIVKQDPINVKAGDIAKMLQRPRVSGQARTEPEEEIVEMVEVKRVASEPKPAKEKEKRKEVVPQKPVEANKETFSPKIPQPPRCNCTSCVDKSKCQSPPASCSKPQKEPINLKIADISNLLQKPRIAQSMSDRHEVESTEPFEVKRQPPGPKPPVEPPTASNIKHQKENPACNCDKCNDRSKCQHQRSNCERPKLELVSVKPVDLAKGLQKPRLPTVEHDAQIVEPIEVKKQSTKPPPKQVVKTQDLPPVPSAAKLQAEPFAPRCNCSSCQDKSKCRSPPAICQPTKTEPIAVRHGDLSNLLQKPRVPHSTLNEFETLVTEPTAVKDKTKKRGPIEPAIVSEKPPKDEPSTAPAENIPKAPRCSCSTCKDKSKCQGPPTTCEPAHIDPVLVKSMDLAQILQKPRVPQSGRNEQLLEVSLPTEVKEKTPRAKSVPNIVQVPPKPSAVNQKLETSIPKCNCSSCVDKTKCLSPPLTCEKPTAEPVSTKAADFSKGLQKPRVPQSRQDEDEILITEPIEVKKQVSKVKIPSKPILDSNKQTPVPEKVSHQQDHGPVCNCSTCQDKSKCQSPPSPCEPLKKEPVSIKAADISRLLQKPRVSQATREETEIQLPTPHETKKESPRVIAPVVNTDTYVPASSSKPRIPKCNCTSCQDKSKCESPPSGCYRPAADPITVKPADFSKGMQKPRVPQSMNDKHESQPTEPIEVKKQSAPVKSPQKPAEDIQLPHETQSPKCNCNTCKDKSKCRSPPSSCEPAKIEPTVLKTTDISKMMHKPRVPKSVLDEGEIQSTEPVEIRKEEPKPHVPPVPVSNNVRVPPIVSTADVPHQIHAPQCSCNTCNAKSKCQAPHSDCQPIVKVPIDVKATDPSKLLQKPKISQPMENSHEIQFTEPIEVKKATPRIVIPPEPVADVRKPAHIVSTQELRPLQNETKCHCNTCQDKSKCMSPPTSCKPIKPDPIKLKSADIAKILQKPRLVHASLSERPLASPDEPIEIKKTAQKRVSKTSSPLISDISSGHESDGAHTSRVCSCMECNESRKRKLPKERFLCVGCLPRNTGGSIACELLENFDDSAPMITHDINADDISVTSSYNNESPCVCQKPPVCPTKHQDEESSPTEYKPKRPPVQPQVMAETSVFRPQHPVHSFKNVQPVHPISPSVIEVDSKSPAVTEKSKPEKVVTISKPIKNSSSSQTILHEAHNDMCPCKGCQISREKENTQPVEVFKPPAGKVPKPKPPEMQPVQVKKEATPPGKKPHEPKFKTTEFICKGDDCVKPVEVLKPVAGNVPKPKPPEMEPVQVKQNTGTREKIPEKPKIQLGEALCQGKDCETPVEIFHRPQKKVPKPESTEIVPIHTKPKLVTHKEKSPEPKFQIVDVNFAKPKCACDDICGKEIPIIDPIDLKPNDFKLVFQKPRIPVETSDNVKEQNTLEKVRTKIDLDDKTEDENVPKKLKSEKDKTCDCTKCGGTDICKLKAEECKPKPVEYKQSDNVATDVLKPIPSDARYTERDKAKIEAIDHLPPSANKYKKTHEESLKGMELPLAIKPIPVKIVVPVETKEIQHKPKQVDNKHTPLKLSPIVVKPSPIRIQYPVETGKFQSKPKEIKEALATLPVKTGEARLKPKDVEGVPVKVKSTPAIPKKPIVQQEEKNKSSKSSSLLPPISEQLPVETKQTLPKQKPSKPKTAITAPERSKPVAPDPPRKQISKDASHGQSCPCQACKREALPKIEPVTLKSPAGVKLLTKPRIPPVSLTDQSILAKARGAQPLHWDSCTCDICQNRNDCKYGPKECQTKSRKVDCINCCKKQDSASSANIIQRSDSASLHPKTPIVPDKPVILAKPEKPIETEKPIKIEEPIEIEKPIEPSSNISIKTILSPQPTIESSGETLLCSTETTLDSSIELVFHDSREEYSSSPMSWCSCPSSKSSSCICHRSGDGSDKTKIICIGKLSEPSEEIVETCSESTLHSCVPSCTCMQEGIMKKQPSCDVASISRESSYESVIGASHSGSTIVTSVESEAVHSEVLSSLTESSCLSVFSSFTCKDDDVTDSEISSSKCGENRPANILSDTSRASSCQISVGTDSCKSFSTEDRSVLSDHSLSTHSSLDSRKTGNRPSQSLKSLVEVNSTKSLVLKAPSLIEPNPTEPTSPCGIPSAIKKASKESISTKDSMLTSKESCACAICLLVSGESSVSTTSTEITNKSSMPLPKPEIPLQKPAKLPQKPIEQPCKPAQPSKPIDTPRRPIEIPQKPIDLPRKPPIVPQKPVAPSQKPICPLETPIATQKEPSRPDQSTIPSRPSRKDSEQFHLCPNKCGCPDCPFLQQSQKQVHTERQSPSTIHTVPSRAPRYERSRPQPCGCSNRVSKQCSHCGGIKPPSARQQQSEDVLRVCMIPNDSSATYGRGCGSINQGLNNDETCSFNNARSLLDSDAEVHGISETAKALFNFVFAELKQIKDIIQRSFNIDNTNSCANLDNNYNSTCNNSTCDPSFNCPCMSLNQNYPQRFSHLHDVSHPCMFADLKPFESVPRIPRFCGPTYNQDFHVIRPPTTASCYSESSVKILSVKPVGKQSLMVSWMLDPSGNVDGYEVFVDNNMKCRTFTPARNAAIVNGVDADKEHQIRVIAVPHNGQTSHNSLTLRGLYLPPERRHISAHTCYYQPLNPPSI